MVVRFGPEGGADEGTEDETAARFSRQHDDRGGRADGAAPAPLAFLPGAGRPIDVPERGPLSPATSERWAAAPGGEAASAGQDPVDDEAEEEPVDPADIERQVVSMLARKGRSEAEVRAAAIGAGLEAHDAEAIVDRMRDLGYVNDGALAEQLMMTLSDRGGKGAQAIRRALVERKLEASAIDGALEQLDEDDEAARAGEVARKRAGQLGGLAPAVAERRLSAYLARRGFTGPVARTAVAEALAGRAGGGRGSRGVVRFD